MLSFFLVIFYFFIWTHFINFSLPVLHPPIVMWSIFYIFARCICILFSLWTTRICIQQSRFAFCFYFPSLIAQHISREDTTCRYLQCICVCYLSNFHNKESKHIYAKEKIIRRIYNKNNKGKKFNNVEMSEIWENSKKKHIMTGVFIHAHTVTSQKYKYTYTYGIFLFVCV